VGAEVTVTDAGALRLGDADIPLPPGAPDAVWLTV
jgi:hypothetical protein